MTALSSNVLADMFGGAAPQRPVFQITEIKRDASGKHRCYISDGVGKAPAVMNSSTNELFADETIKPFSVVRLNECIVTTVGKTAIKVVVMMAVELLEHRNECIGDPMQVADMLKAQAASTESAATPLKGHAPHNGNTTPESSTIQSRTQPLGFANATGPPKISQPTPAGAFAPTPIGALNPYTSKWTIKAKVTQMGELRQTTAKGVPVSVWEMVVADESGEIKMTAWRENADRFSRIATEGGTFLISRGQIRMANKRFSTTSNCYEITLTNDSHMAPCHDDVAIFTPAYRYEFTPIADLASKPANATVDVAGVVTATGPLVELTSKKGTQLVKRILTISDDSNAAIEMTLWGSTAQSFPDDVGSAVVTFKGVQVSDWNTKSLGMGRSSRMQIDPSDVPDAKRLRTWADGGGAAHATTLSVNTRNEGGGGGASAGDDLAELQEAAQGLSEGASVYATVRCFVSKVLTNKGGQSGEERPIWFASCTKCGKKAVGDDSTGFSCEACGWSGQAATYRYVVALLLEDASAASYGTAFQDQAQKILEKSADEMKAIKDSSKDAFDSAVQAVVWKRYSFRLKLKHETYQGQDRPKLSIVSVSPVNFVADGKRLLERIQRYELPDEVAPQPVAPASEAEEPMEEM